MRTFSFPGNVTQPMMSIEVEFFGIPRERAGTDRTTVLRGQSSALLANIFSALGTEFPDFAAACLDGNKLQCGYVASINGEFFTSCDAIVESGKSVLILSADAGG